MGKPFIDFVHPDDRQDTLNEMSRQIRTGTSINFTNRYLCIDGSVKWLSWTANYIVDEGVTYAVARDITERKLTEEKMRKLSTAVEQSAAAIIITDKNGIIEYVNPIFYKTTGYAEEEVIGKNPSILKSVVTTDEEYSNLWKTISSGNVWMGEFSNKKKNGEIYWESASISPIFNESGEITHYVAVNEDITERKLAEQEKYKAIFIAQEREQNRIATDLHDGVGQTIAAANMYMSALTGLIKDQLDAGNIYGNKKIST